MFAHSIAALPLRFKESNPILFNQLRKKILSETGGGRTQVYVCSFGKHPGWSDHAEPIGLETDRLREFKRMFYDDGFRGAIESGTWDELKPEQRIEELDHVLVWRTERDVIVGRFWSSTDKAGRPKYPMVVAAQCQGLPLVWALQVVLPALRELETQLRQTESVESVRSAVFVTRDALRVQGADREAVALNVSADRSYLKSLTDRFQESSRVSKEGFHRILYRINRVGITALAGEPGSGTSTRSTNAAEARVPRMADGLEASLHEWGRLIAAAVEPLAPFFMIAPESGDWIDVIVGEPRSSHVSVVRKNLNALPLTTEVPYQMEAEFLRGVERLISDRPAAGGGAASVSEESASTHPERGAAAGRSEAGSRPAEPGPPKPQPREESERPAEKKGLLGRRLWMFMAIGIVVIGGSVGGWWLSSRGQGSGGGDSSSSSTASTATSTSDSTTSTTPEPEPQVVRTEMIEEIRGLLRQLPRGQPVAERFEAHLALVTNLKESDSTPEGEPSNLDVVSGNDLTLLGEFRDWLAETTTRQLHWDCLLADADAEAAMQNMPSPIQRLVAIDDLDRYEVTLFSGDLPSHADIRPILNKASSDLDAIEFDSLSETLQSKHIQLGQDYDALRDELEQAIACEACRDEVVRQFVARAGGLRDRVTAVRREAERFAAGEELESIRSEAHDRVTGRLQQIETAIEESDVLDGLAWLPTAIAERADTESILDSSAPDEDADKLISQLDGVAHSIAGLADSLVPAVGERGPSGESWRQTHWTAFRTERESAINAAWSDQAEDVASVDQLATFLHTRKSLNDQRATDLDSVFARAREVSRLLEQNQLPTDDARATIASWNSMMASESATWVLNALEAPRILGEQYLEVLRESAPAAIWPVVTSENTPPAVIWAAWVRLRNLDAVPDPTSVESIATLQPLIEAHGNLEPLASGNAELKSLLPPDGKALWNAYVRENVFQGDQQDAWTLDDQERLDEAMRSRSAFGLPEDEEGIPVDIRFNVVLAQMKHPDLDESEVASRIDEWQSSLEALDEMPAASGLAAKLNDLKDSIGNDTTRGTGGAPMIEVNQVVGPERMAWTRRNDPNDPERLIFESRTPQRGHAISFRAVLTVENVTTYLSEEEASIGVCGAVLDAARASGGEKATLADELVSRLAGVTNWAGPKSWTVEGQSLQADLAKPGSDLAGWLDPAHLSGMRQILPDGTNFPAQMYPADATPAAPGERHPMQLLSASEAAALAMLSGCRLPTDDEWNAALAIAGGFDRVARSANLRDTAWMRQRDHLIAEEARFDRERGGGDPQAANLNIASYWPDANIFPVVSPPRGSVPAGPEAEIWSGDLQAFGRTPQFPYADGTLWFDEVSDRPDSGGFAGLIGNVFEFVLHDGADVALALEEPVSNGSIPTSVLEIARLFVLDRNDTKVGVIGGSALSPPDAGLQTLHPLRRSQVAGNRFADVGFRFAFRARTKSEPRVSVMDEFRALLMEEPFISLKE